MADIFLAYSRSDSVKALTVAERLRTDGWTVFMDIETPIGERWHQSMRRELAAAAAIVVLWSTKSSDSDHVLDEADIGRRENKLFPALLERIDPPYGFTRYQAADLVAWNPVRPHVGMDSLILSLRARLGTPAIDREKIQARQAKALGDLAQLIGVNAAGVGPDAARNYRGKPMAKQLARILDMRDAELKQALECYVPESTLDRAGVVAQIEEAIHIFRLSMNLFEDAARKTQN